MNLAQTNLALYRQMGTSGWSEPDIERLVRAYRLCYELFTGRYPASGKTFIAHCIGTASAAEKAGLRPDLVLTGLTHAAYTLGSWGDGNRAGRTDARAAELRKSIGEAPERLVANYSELEWTSERVARWIDDPGALSTMDRDTILVRIANDCDDQLDGAVRLSSPERTDIVSDLGRHLLGRFVLCPVASRPSPPVLGCLAAERRMRAILVVPVDGGNKLTPKRLTS